MKLLIIDDHELNLRVLRAQLEAEGHTVLDAANGVEALEVLEQQTVDGVISDILMPQMDGYRLCLEVRKNPRFGRVPFVLYTSTYNSEADRELAVSAGADAYIVKPAPVSALLDALSAAGDVSRPLMQPGADSSLESPVLKQYSETLVRKLEEKSHLLERAHDGLVIAEARLSALVSSAMDAIIAVDEAHTIVLFNPAAGKMFGCAPERAVGRPLNDFIPLRFRASHEVQMRDFGEEREGGRRMQARDVSALRSDGTEFPIEASISKLETPQGRLYTVFVRDITDRQRAAQALAHSEAGLRRAQDLAQLAHVIVRMDGSFESWSETLPRLVGMDAARMPRSMEAWIDLIHPEDRTHVGDRVFDAIRKGTRAGVEYRLRRQDRWIDVRQILDPLQAGPSGTPVPGRMFNTLQNISAQKQAEARIRSLNRVYAVLSGISSLIVRVGNQADLFRESCRIAVEVGQFPGAWIGLIEDDPETVRLVACHGAEPARFERLRELLDPVSAGAHSTISEVIASGLPFFSNDVTLDVRLAGRAGLVAAGSRSLAVLPLVVDGRTVGTLSLHSDVPDDFTTAEMRLLTELANDIAFAIDHLSKADRIVYLAKYDALTGLPNRRLFGEELEQRLQEADGRRGMFAVVLVDLEKFRRVNETLGRHAGDELLKQASIRLQRLHPMVARIGVDLFALPIEGKHSVAELAHVVDETAAACFDEAFVIAGESLRIGCRSGIAVFPSDGGDAETLLRNAEAALRRARFATQHCVFYAPDMNARASEALAFESRLRQAIEREEFVLHYQPKVSCADGTIRGLEALIRWQDPDHGLVAPARFISVLEEAGLIGAVGRWALRQALADHRRWREAGHDAPRVAVNVSSMQLREPDFAAQVTAIVGADGGPALELEITESVIMENMAGNIAMLKGVRSRGVTVALDDFGTGYSSLAYIAKLPVTSLKIDRAFVVAMSEGQDGVVMVSTIIALAHALKLKVVAEGVETGKQARLLREMSCDEAQGYLFSRPVPADEIEAMLRSGAPLSQHASA